MRTTLLICFVVFALVLLRMSLYSVDASEYVDWAPGLYAAQFTDRDPAGAPDVVAGWDSPGVLDGPALRSGIGSVSGGHPGPGPGIGKGPHDPPVRVPALAGQVEIGAFAVKRHAEPDQPLDRQRRPLDHVFDLFQAGIGPNNENHG